MKAFLTQIIVVIVLLIVGFLLYITYSGPDVTTKEWGELKKENATLQTSNEVLNGQNQKLTVQNEKLNDENETLKLSNKYLKVDHRLARIEVLEQKSEPENPSKIVETKIRFTEFDPSSGSIVAKPAEFTVAGDMIYVDALVVKFQDQFIEAADSLRGRSLVSFQRVFGENQTPAQGFRIDAQGMIPAVYRSGSENEEAGALEKQIWENFWTISNDPERQKELGIRAIHGEAPSQRLQPGRIYHLDLRASDGLSFRIE